MFQVGVFSINQEVSFEDGSITNFVTLILPSGLPIKAVVTDEGAAALINARLHPGAAPAASPAPPAPHAASPPVTSEEHGGAVVFGGSGEDEGEAPTFWPGPSAPASPIAPPAPVDADLSSDDPSKQAAAFRRQQVTEKNRRGEVEAREVPKDNYGYPIVRGAGQDPNDVMGGSSTVDEDGVGQF